jgi:PAS domain S-box-containing protein
MNDTFQRKGAARAASRGRDFEILSTVIASVPTALAVVGPDARLLSFNRSFLDVLDIPPETLFAGDPLEKLLRYFAERGDYGEGDVETQVRENLRRALGSGRRHYQWRVAGGRRLEISHKALQGGGFVTTIADVSERQDKEALVRRAWSLAEGERARLTDWADVSNDWFWEADETGKLTFVSSGFETALGLPPSGAIGRLFFDIGSEPARPGDPVWNPLTGALRQRRPFREFQFAVAIDGMRRYISTSGKPVYDSDNAFRGYRGTGRDVTMRVRAEQGLEQQAEMLRGMVDKLDTARANAVKALAEADRANKSKSYFLASMSHELRTPLNAIIGFSELLTNQLFGTLDRRYVEYARDIHVSGRYLLRLINDILDQSKIDAGRLELYDEVVDLKDLIAECLRLLRDRADEKSIRLRMVVPADTPALRGDRLRLKQVLLNLLSNAIKFTLEGGRVVVSAARPSQGGVSISVEDTGVGMRPESIPLALEPFRQVESPFARHHEGTGLGLPLARSLVDLHGGALTLESEPGKGTVVRVALPAERLV